MKGIIKKSLLFIMDSSGIFDERGLLWWHPLVILIAVFTICKIILKGIKNTFKEVQHFLIKEKFRTKI